MADNCTAAPGGYICFAKRQGGDFAKSSTNARLKVAKEKGIIATRRVTFANKVLTVKFVGKDGKVYFVEGGNGSPRDCEVIAD